MKYYLKFSEEEGTILGLNIDSMPQDGDNWYECTEEVYNTVLDNNGKNPSIDLDKFSEDVELITIEYIIKEKDTPIDVVKRNKIQKMPFLCNYYIEYGIVYDLNGERLHFTYKADDQLNYAELNQLVDKGILTEIPIKESEADTYRIVDKETFKTIYHRLVRNKYYNLFRLKELEKYIDTLEDKTVVYRLDYEVSMPEEYNQRIEDKLALFNWEEI